MADSGVSDEGCGTFGGITPAHSMRSAAEVDKIVAAASASGATVTRPPATLEALPDPYVYVSYSQQDRPSSNNSPPSWRTTG